MLSLERDTGVPSISLRVNFSSRFLLCFAKFTQMASLSSQSGIRESNPFFLLGKQMLSRSTNPAFRFCRNVGDKVLLHNKNFLRGKQTLSPSFGRGWPIRTADLPLPKRT